MIKSRLFIGIDVSHSLKDTINMTSSTIECEKRDIKWNTGTNLHITLLFLGNIEKSLLPKIVKNINNSYLVEPFKISIESTGVFPNQIYPRTFWLGIKKGRQYIEGLHNGLEKKLKKFISIKQNNLYVPHVTIGRSNSTLNYNKLNIQNYLNTLYDPITLYVNSIGLYESKLCPEGSNYTLVNKFDLD
tara:strand:- start:32 stop:595 length:564 start_codon:yes stop_codon:yes gene_type:complete